MTKEQDSFILFGVRLNSMLDKFLAEVNALEMFLGSKIISEEGTELKQKQSSLINIGYINNAKFLPQIDKALDESVVKQYTDTISVDFEGDGNLTYFVKSALIHFKELAIREQQLQNRIENMQVALALNYLIAIFDAMIIDFTRELLKKEPSLLISTLNPKEAAEKKITYEEVFKVKNLNEIVDSLIESRLLNFGYGSIDEQVKFLKRCLKGNFLPPEVSEDALIEMRATRNIFTHNKGIVNEIYNSIVKDSKFKMDEYRKVDKEYFNKCSFLCVNFCKGLFGKMLINYRVDL
jgi:hypothetical protein